MELRACWFVIYVFFAFNLAFKILNYKTIWNWRNSESSQVQAEFKLTIMAVISSLEKLTFCQISVAIFTNLSAASSYSSFMQRGAIRFMTSWFYKYSQIPSEATTRNLSYWLISNSNISGYAEVPAFRPALSPKERVIAKPGIGSYFIQTLKGPKSSPF